MTPLLFIFVSSIMLGNNNSKFGSSGSCWYFEGLKFFSTWLIDGVYVILAESCSLLKKLDFGILFNNKFNLETFPLYRSDLISLKRPVSNLWDPIKSKNVLMGLTDDKTISAKNSSPFWVFIPVTLLFSKIKFLASFLNINSTPALVLDL